MIEWFSRWKLSRSWCCCCQIYGWCNVLGSRCLDSTVRGNWEEIIYIFLMVFVHMQRNALREMKMLNLFFHHLLQRAFSSYAPSVSMHQFVFVFFLISSFNVHTQPLTLVIIFNCRAVFFSVTCNVKRYLYTRDLHVIVIHHNFEFALDFFFFFVFLLCSSLSITSSLI